MHSLSEAAIRTLFLVAISVYWLTSMFIRRRHRARWHLWRIVIAAYVVVAVVSVATFALTDTPPNWAYAGLAVMVLTWAAARTSATTVSATSMRQLAAQQAKWLARTERDRARTPRDFPIDTDAIANFCTSTDLVIVNIDGGQGGNDGAFVSPSLTGYILPKHVNAVADAASDIGARVLILDSTETAPAEVLSDFGSNSAACFPPDAAHIPLPDDVSISPHLATAIRHSVLIVVATDRNDVNSAYAAWAELAAAGRRETSR